MKKVMIFGAIALFGLSSCKKDWTCECTYSINPTNEAAELGITATKSTYQFPIIEQTKSSATTYCDALKNNYSQISNGNSQYYTYSGTCNLK